MPDLDHRRRQWAHRRPAALARLITRDQDAYGNLWCAYCGAALAHPSREGSLLPVPPEQGGGYICAEGFTHLQVDHVVPLSLGGSDDLHNLVLCCGPCNARKGAR